MPVGSYPTAFLGYLFFYIAHPNHKIRYPRKWVGYKPLGSREVILVMGFMKGLGFRASLVLHVMPRAVSMEDCTCRLRFTAQL